MCDKSRNTWLCVHWQWNTLEWCQLNALQASPVVHLVTPLSCVSLSMNTQPSVPTINRTFWVPATTERPNHFYGRTKVARRSQPCVKGAFEHAQNFPATMASMAMSERPICHPWTTKATIRPPFCLQRRLGQFCGRTREAQRSQPLCKGGITLYGIAKPRKL